MNNKKKKPATKLSHGKRQIIFCRWLDHVARATSPGWIEVDERTMPAIECESVGFKVFEDKDILVLGISQDHLGKISDTMHIMKSCITKRRILK